MTAKVTERQAATSSPGGQKNGGALGTGALVSGSEEVAEDGGQRAGLVRGDCLRRGGAGALSEMICGVLARVPAHLQHRRLFELCPRGLSSKG